MRSVKRAVFGLAFVVLLPALSFAASRLPATDSILSSPSRFSEQTGDALFPEPAGIKPNIYFWIDVYTKYGTNQAVLHDMNNLSIRYEVVDFDKVFKHRASWKAKNRYLEKRKKYYKKLLLNLSRRNGKCKTADECRIKGLFAEQSGRKQYRDASRSIRGQFGLASRFREGLETSGMYLREMRVIFRSYGLPASLLALPHVESSFNIKAYSSRGAAGIWQFTRYTGKLFMKVDYTIDQRRDPLIATVAAAELLKQNYETLGSWPLAITAYNYGRGGMVKAKKRHGDDIVAIVKHFKSRGFGFASRNFYAEFIAAKTVSENPQKYFGPLNYKPQIKYDTVTLKHFIPADLLTGYFGYDAEHLKLLNQSLRRPIWNGTRRIPRGYKLKVPYGTAERFSRLYANAPKNRLHGKQLMPDYYRIRRGDTLSVLAHRFHTSIRKLQAYNNLSSRHRIYIGKKLRIPPAKYGGVRIARVSAPLRAIPKKVRASLSAHKQSPASSTVALNSAKTDTIRKISVSIIKPDINGYDFIRMRKNYGVIRVRPEETLGHYSYWSGASIKAIQRLNGWLWKKKIHHGQLIKIPLTRVKPQKFVANRYEYHLGLFEDFFASFKVERVESVVVSKGDSLWSICHRAKDTPRWLVALYNPDQKLDRLRLGQKMNMPVVEKR